MQSIPSRNHKPPLNVKSGERWEEEGRGAARRRRRRRRGGELGEEESGRADLPPAR